MLFIELFNILEEGLTLLIGYLLYTYIYLDET